MREVTLNDQIVRAAKVNRDLVMPDGQRTTRNWPLCLTCGREVDAAEIKNVSSKGCEILARCHGKEDYYRVTWNVPQSDVSKNILDDVNVGWAVKRALHDFCPFPPEHQFDFSSRR